MTIQLRNAAWIRRPLSPIFPEFEIYEMSIGGIRRNKDCWLDGAGQSTSLPRILARGRMTRHGN